MVCNTDLVMPYGVYRFEICGVGKMNRLAAFSKLQSHPHYGPKIQKLSAIAILFIQHELEKTGAMDNDEFTVHVRNLFLGNPRKPRNWGELDDILMACRS